MWQIVKNPESTWKNTSTAGSLVAVRCLIQNKRVLRTKQALQMICFPVHLHAVLFNHGHAKNEAPCFGLLRLAALLPLGDHRAACGAFMSNNQLFDCGTVLTYEGIWRCSLFTFSQEQTHKCSLGVQARRTRKLSEALRVANASGMPSATQLYCR